MYCVSPYSLWSQAICMLTSRIVIHKNIKRESPCCFIDRFQWLSPSASIFLKERSISANSQCFPMLTFKTVTPLHSDRLGTTHLCSYPSSGFCFSTSWMPSMNDLNIHPRKFLSLECGHWHGKFSFPLIIFISHKIYCKCIRKKYVEAWLPKDYFMGRLFSSFLL